MKKLLFIFIASFCWIISNAQWRVAYQGTLPNTSITGISFYKPFTGYVAADNWVGYTTDSGKTVSKRYVAYGNTDFSFDYSVNLTFPFNIEGVKAFSADTLLVYGDYGFEPTILYSTNGGSNWKIVYHKKIPFDKIDIVNTLADMFFPGNGSVGYAVQGDEIVKSTNRGASWQTVVSLNEQHMFRLTFADTNTGYAAGNNKILKTTDGGASWSPLLNTPASITGISAPSDRWLFVNANSGENYFSSDAGANFTLANAETEKLEASDIVYVNDSVGYAAAGAIYQTRNRGKIWELMPGGIFPYWNRGYTKLFFYDNNYAWAFASNEYMSITNNGGGSSYPKAAFKYDVGSSCTTKTVQLINLGYTNYSYRWLKNGVEFANTYNTSYTTMGATDKIELIATKNGFNDTMTSFITSLVPTAFSLNSRVVKDTVCSNSLVSFEILNSSPGVEYRVDRTYCNNCTGTAGNGGTLIIAASTGNNEDSTVRFIVSAYRNEFCGVQTANDTFNVRIVNSTPATTALTDTICDNLPFNITVTDSKPGYQYWADNSIPPVNGTGGAIQLPAKISLSSQTYTLDPDNLIYNYRIPLYTKNAAYGCTGQQPITTVPIVGLKTRAGFITNSHEMLVGDKLSFVSESKKATSYVWTFTDGANSQISTAKEPTNIFFTTPGRKLIEQKTINTKGCPDIATRYIEVFSSPAITEAPVCEGLSGNQAIDSIRRQNYFIGRAFYEDENGDRIVAGGYTNMKYQFYPRGYEGFFAAKFSKAGSLIWYLENKNENGDFYQYNRNAHIIIEHAISDKRGNTYLLGHSLNQFNIADSTNNFSIPKASAFLIKITPTGKITWIKSLYNIDTWGGTNISEDYTGGSLLRGKNDDIYVITHRNATTIYWGFMSGNDMVAVGNQKKTGIIIQYDTNGNIKRTKDFPITYNNLRRYSSDGADSYDRLPPATWDSSGHLVIYGTLNTNEMGGNQIDGFTIPFSTAVRSALLFFDTTTLKVTDVKPVFLQSGSSMYGINSNSYAIDAAGNYYAAYTTKIYFPASTPIYANDNLKYKSYVLAYDVNSNLRWTKQLEGLQPLNMLAYAKDLKVYGSNYIGSGYTNGGLNFSSNASPTTEDVKKLTMVTDPGEFTGQGKKGLGSFDNVIASLNTGTGNLQTVVSLGTVKEDIVGTMRRGFGDQLWITGVAGYTYTDTTTTLFTYKLPVTNNCNLLPVKLAYFKAICSAGREEVRCEWQTQGELNAYNFIIEKSTDGNSWATAATIPAKGTTIIQQNYQWSDAIYSNANYFYRLKQVDKDGNTTYSSIVKTSCTGKTIAGLRVYPNPANNFLKAKIISPVASFAPLRLYNYVGQLVLERNLYLREGANIQDVDLSALPGGIYRLTVNIRGEEVLSQNVIKQ